MPADALQGDVLVIAEHWNGAPDGVTLQMLTKGRELADAAGVGLAVLVLGNGLDGVVDALRACGMDTIWVLDDPALSQAGGALEAHAIAAAADVIAPGLILIGYSLVGMELAPAIAVKLGVTAMTNCANAEIADGAVVVTRPFFDGTQHARIILDGEGPALVALQRGATPTVKLDGREVSVAPVAVDVAALPARSQVLEVIEEAPSDVDITKAELIVSVGRGIGGKEKILVIEELAQALGGLMACSRPLVDLGWLPRERQVGASGKSVAPKIYLACGISGASQHLSGMSESRLIIAINKDSNAPIFQVAHYGVVGDLFEIVPALTAEAGKNAG
jgi:electron transfer flavoprotein alpha subunit